MDNITDRFINLIASINYSDISVSAHSKFRTCLADTIGVTLAGCYDLKAKTDSLLNSLNDGASVVYPLGIGHKTSESNAILINGINAHYLELDDGVR